MLPRRIVALGASSIHGSFDDELGGFVNRLRFWHEANGPKNRVYNLGIYGETTESLAERIVPEASARRAELLVVYPGLNDTRRVGSAENENDVSLNEYRGMMELVVERCLSVAPTLIITAYPFDEARTSPYPGSDWFYLRDDAARYIGVLKEVCQEKGAMVLDLFEKWASLDMNPYLAEDGLHANVLGHQKVFEEVKGFLTSSL